MTDGSSIYYTQARAALDEASSDPQRALLLGRDLSLALTPADGAAWIYARLAVAIASTTIEEYGVAAEAADDVVTLAGSLGEHSAKRTALRTQAICQRADGQWRSADRTLRTTVDLAFASQDPQSQIAGIVLRAQMYEALGSFVVATSLFGEATRIADTHRDELPDRVFASAQINAARCVWLLRDNTRTAEYLSRAETALQRMPRGTFHIYHDALALRLRRRVGHPIDVNKVVHLLNEARSRGLAALVVELDAELALTQGAEDGLQSLLECVQRWRSRREFPLALDLLSTLDELVSKSDTLHRGAVDRERTATVLHAVRARGATLERADRRPVFGKRKSGPTPPSKDALEAKAVLMQLKGELHQVSDTMATQLGWPSSTEYSCLPPCDDVEKLLADANGPCLAASVRRDVERLARLHSAREHSDVVPGDSDIARRLATLERTVGLDPARALAECNAIEQSLADENNAARGEIAVLRVEALFILESWHALKDALRIALDASPAAAARQRLRTVEVAVDNVKAVSQGSVRAATQKLADARSNGRTRDALTLLESLARACDEVALLESGVTLRTRGVEIAELCDDPAVHRSGAMLALELAQHTDPQAGHRWLQRAAKLLELSPSPYYETVCCVTEHTLTLQQSANEPAVEELKRLHDDAVSRGWEGVTRRAASALGYGGQLDHDGMMRLCDDLSRSGRVRESAELALQQAELAADIGLDRESRALSQLSFRLSSTVEAHQLQVSALRAEELHGFPDLLPLPISDAAGSELPLSAGLSRVGEVLGTMARTIGCDSDELFAQDSRASSGFSSSFGSAVSDATLVNDLAAKVRAVLSAVDKASSHTPLSQTAPHLTVREDADKTHS